MKFYISLVKLNTQSPTLPVYFKNLPVEVYFITTQKYNVNELVLDQSKVIQTFTCEVETPSDMPPVNLTLEDYEYFLLSEDAEASCKLYVERIASAPKNGYGLC